MTLIPPELFARIRQLLLPLVGTVEERRALMTEAFPDLGVRNQLTYEGAADVFATHCIEKLFAYGSLTEGEPVLNRLLRTIRTNHLGAGYHLEIDELMQLTQRLRRSDKATASLDGTRTLELAYLKKLQSDYLLHLDRYTPIRGDSQQQRRTRMRIACSLEPALHTDAPKPFVDAVAEIPRIRRAVLLGEPGGGKTTILWKVVDNLVTAAYNDEAAPLPLFIPLGFWRDAEQPLTEFIAAELEEQMSRLGTAFDGLLREKRAALFLDGLNELPVGQRANKYPQVKQFLQQHRELLAVVACRKEDYTELDFGLDRIVIKPLDGLQIQEFVGRYLNTERGETLFWKLAGEQTHSYYDDFIAKVGAEHEEVFWCQEQLPADLRWAYDWDDENQYSQWGEWHELREQPASLMALARNPYMLWMITRVFDKRGELPTNRGALFREFVEELLEREAQWRELTNEQQTSFIQALAAVAYAMQSQSGEDGNARTVLSLAEVNQQLDRPALRLASSASILSIGEQVRFTHQLLQEYFAARFMDNEIRAGRLEATAIWLPEQWWERTNWEEAAILLAGLYSDDCSFVVEWLAEANPEVAAQCITRSGASLAATTRERLRSLWLPRLTDLQRDSEPKARAAVGRALALTGWDNRKGTGVIRDVRGIALPDIEWVTIPGGEFPYGHKDKSDNPPQKITLPTYEISRYPITHAQFQTWLDDPAGYADARWFDGLAASEDDRRIYEQDFQFANHPREMVNWYQSLAFCRWLSWRMGGGYDLQKVDEWAVRLPTEYEWENAARGTDGRLYPYQGKFDATKGNTDETGIRQTNAVGIFPNGASPYGVEEMSGNVWEWCLSNYQNPARTAEQENLATDDRRVLRGGSWNLISANARAVCRVNIHPAHGYLVGFRVVRGLHPLLSELCLGRCAQAQARSDSPQSSHGRRLKRSVA